jgi:hypothetical protein
MAQFLEIIIYKITSMKSVLFFSLSFLFLVGCEYNEEQGCYEKPSYKVCDAVDGPPATMDLQVKLLGNTLYPVKIKIYNRTVADGIGSLHSTFTQYDYLATYELPEGRYTALLVYPDQTTAVMDFRVYIDLDVYCSGNCYIKNNAYLEIQKPIE